MDEDTKFSRMLDLLRTDRTAREKLLTDPSGVLKGLGLDESILNEPRSKKALSRAEALLSDAGIQDTDDAVAGLKKLGNSAGRHFSVGYEVEVDPFGITLLERVPGSSTLGATATGTTKCTFSPWDGCKPDVDF